MIILQPAEGEDDLDRLAGVMLAIERGALPDGTKFPTVDLPPVTRHGLGVTIHYRATVGIVYHPLASQEFAGLAGLVGRLRTALEAQPADHLLERCVGVTASAVLMETGGIARGTTVVGPRKPFSVPVGRDTPLPARLLLMNSSDELPPPQSFRAGFTWVFMRATSVFKMCNPTNNDGATGVVAVFGPKEVNALVASVYYDTTRALGLPDMSIVHDIKLADLASSQGLPPGLADGGLGKGALVVYLDGSVAYAEAFAPPRRGRAAALAALPLAAMPADIDESIGTAGVYRCRVCTTPLAGDVALVRNARGPEVRHQGWAWCGSFDSEMKIPSFLMCSFCWGATDPTCFDHLKAKLSRVRLDYTQADACDACPGLHGVATILRGRAAPVPGADGAFTLTLADGARVILASKNLGQLPSLTSPALAALRLPILSELSIAQQVDDPVGAVDPPTLPVVLNKKSSKSGSSRGSSSSGSSSSGGSSSGSSGSSSSNSGGSFSGSSSSGGSSSGLFSASSAASIVQEMYGNMTDFSKALVQDLRNSFPGVIRRDIPNYVPAAPPAAAPPVTAPAARPAAAPAARPSESDDEYDEDDSLVQELLMAEFAWKK